MRRFIIVFLAFMAGLTAVDFLLNPAVIGDRIKWYMDPANHDSFFRNMLVRGVTAAVMTFVLNRFDK